MKPARAIFRIEAGLSTRDQKRSAVATSRPAKAIVSFSTGRTARRFVARAGRRRFL